MSQLTIDGSVGVDDRIEEAARVYGPIPTHGLSDFARFCRREGYLDGHPVDDAIVAGDVKFIKKRFKRTVGGVSAWINTGEDGEWISRRRCSSEQHLLYCRLLRKKKDEIEGQLSLELEYRRDRGWGYTEIREL